MHTSQGGNENDSFILSDPIEGILVMNKALDYDHGNREYKIQIQASVSRVRIVVAVKQQEISTKCNIVIGLFRCYRQTLNDWLSR